MVPKSNASSRASGATADQHDDQHDQEAHLDRGPKPSQSRQHWRRLSQPPDPSPSRSEPIP